MPENKKSRTIGSSFNENLSELFIFVIVYYRCSQKSLAKSTKIVNLSQIFRKNAKNGIFYENLPFKKIKKTGKVIFILIIGVNMKNLKIRWSDFCFSAPEQKLII